MTGSLQVHRVAFFMALAFVVCSSVMMSCQARAQENLTVDLASDHVDITTGFNGSHLILFGVKDMKGDVAIVLRGPERDMKVRKKSRVMGLWLNTEHMQFEDIPAFYDFALGKKAAAGKDERSFLKENGVGLDALVFEPEGAVPDREHIRHFQEALIRNKQVQGLFPVHAKPITFLNDNFFKTTMYLPSNVPAGDYTIQTILYRNNKVLDIAKTNLRVAPVGLNAKVYDFAVHHALVYGLICICIALLSGWLINVIRNK